MSHSLLPQHFEPVDHRLYIITFNANHKCPGKIFIQKYDKRFYRLMQTFKIEIFYYTYYGTLFIFFKGFSNRLLRPPSNLFSEGFIDDKRLPEINRIIICIHQGEIALPEITAAKHFHPEGFGEIEIHRHSIHR